MGTISEEMLRILSLLWVWKWLDWDYIRISHKPLSCFNECYSCHTVIMRRYGVVTENRESSGCQLCHDAPNDYKVGIIGTRSFLWWCGKGFHRILSSWYSVTRAALSICIIRVKLVVFLTELNTTENKLHPTEMPYCVYCEKSTNYKQACMTLPGVSVAVWAAHRVLSLEWTTRSLNLGHIGIPR